MARFQLSRVYPLYPEGRFRMKLKRRDRKSRASLSSNRALEKAPYDAGYAAGFKAGYNSGFSEGFAYAIPFGAAIPKRATGKRLT